MSEELKVGDTVVLKSGGPIMTVVEVSASGDIKCAFFWKNTQSGEWVSELTKHLPAEAVQRGEP